MWLKKSWNIKLLAVILILLTAVASGSLFIRNVSGQENDLKKFFSQAKSDPILRTPFIEAYIQHDGLPENVLRIQYSEDINTIALTSPLVRTKSGNYRPTSHALAIGRGYPSSMTFGPKMFHPAYRYADFQSVIQHEAAHAKFWATGKLNHLDRVDTGKDSKVRLRGVLPILFELDAIKTQMDHPSWQRTSKLFRKGQEAYRQKWLNKLEKLQEQSYMHDMKPLLERIRRTYEKP